jgi:hypothetical protein
MLKSKDTFTSKAYKPKNNEFRIFFMAVFWFVTLCGILGRYQRSEGNTVSIFSMFGHIAAHR